MDGYAVNVDDLNHSNELEVQGVITAGMSADEPLQMAKLKIMTGAPMPVNANAVVMVENTGSRDNIVIINKHPSMQDNIRKKANDIACGDTLIQKRTRLYAEHLMLLSSQGNSTVPVSESFA